LLKARADFIAMLTHDIRNPLGTIVGFVQLMRDTETLTREGQELLTHIESGSQSALMLAANFLEASKMEASGLRLNREPTNLRTVLEDVIARQRCVADARGIRLVEE